MHAMKGRTNAVARMLNDNLIVSLIQSPPMVKILVISKAEAREQRAMHLVSNHTDRWMIPHEIAGHSLLDRTQSLQAVHSGSSVLRTYFLGGVDLNKTTVGASSWPLSGRLLCRRTADSLMMWTVCICILETKQ
jgi:hypothetical protein